jgi:peptidyl-prolyl cis-trans isomerase B (cyclophilin B)
MMNTSNYSIRRLTAIFVATCLLLATGGCSEPQDPRSVENFDDGSASAEQVTIQTDERPQTMPEQNPTAVMKTNKGEIRVELFADKAPKTVENFLTYVDEGFFDGTIFHRVIPGFMVQGGGFTPDMQQKSTHAPIKNEADNGVKNTRGTLAMARTNVVDSATAQFFINVADNDFLNHRSKSPDGYGYAVFGRVIDGMEVVDKIVAVQTGRSGPHSDVPVEPVIIESIKRE